MERSLIVIEWNVALRMNNALGCSFPVEAKIHSLTFVDFGFKDSLFKKNRMAQFTFLRFTDLISHFLVYLFGVNCAFLFGTDLVVATNVMLLA